MWAGCGKVQSCGRVWLCPAGVQTTEKQLQGAQQLSLRVITESSSGDAGVQVSGSKAKGDFLLGYKSEWNTPTQLKDEKPSLCVGEGY